MICTRTAAAILGLLTAVFYAPAATAKIVTIGPPSSAPFTKLIRATTAATFFNASITEPGALATSPVDGAVIGLRTAGTTGGPYRLRVLRPLGESLYLGAGTSNPLFFEPPEISVLEPLPIREGDTIGLDLEKGLTVAASEPTTATTANWAPPLADGESRAYGGFHGNHEFAFQAEVLPPPEVFRIQPRSVDFRHPAKVTIVGENLAFVRGIFFGNTEACCYRVLSERKIVITPPRSHHPRKVRVAVRTFAGTSPRNAAASFTFLRSRKP